MAQYIVQEVWTIINIYINLQSNFVWFIYVIHSYNVIMCDRVASNRFCNKSVPLSDLTIVSVWLSYIVQYIEIDLSVTFLIWLNIANRLHTI